jgi:hypothetical protein
MKSIGELRRRAFSEGAAPKPLLTFDGVSLPVTLCREIRLDRCRKSVNLLCHECRQLCRRPLTGSQRTSRIAQIAQHKCATEAVMVAPTPTNDREISGGQRIVTVEFTRFAGGSNSASIWASVSCCRRIVHAPLEFRTGRPADPSQRVDERAALNPKGAAHRGFRRTAFERRDDGRHFFGINRDRALLDQRSLELRQRAEDVEQEFALRRGGGVHLLGQRAERDAARLQLGRASTPPGNRPA